MAAASRKFVPLETFSAYFEGRSILFQEGVETSESFPETWIVENDLVGKGLVSEKKK